MVMALIAAWLMMDLFGAFLRESLSVLFGSSAPAFSGLSSLLEFLGIIFVFVGLSVATINKCFLLVDLLPDQVFAWVGGHYQGTGGREMHQGAHQTFVGGVSNVRGQAQMDMRSREASRRGVPPPKEDISQPGLGDL
jgi:hypothetical protein